MNFSQQSISCKYLGHNFLRIPLFPCTTKKNITTKAEKRNQGIAGRPLMQIKWWASQSWQTLTVCLWKVDSLQSQVRKILDGVYIEFAREGPSFFSDIQYLVSLLIISFSQKSNTSFGQKSWNKVSLIMSCASNTHRLPSREGKFWGHDREGEQGCNPQGMEMLLRPVCSRTNFPPDPGMPQCAEGSGQTPSAHAKASAPTAEL